MKNFLIFFFVAIPPSKWLEWKRQMNTLVKSRTLNHSHILRNLSFPRILSSIPSEHCWEENFEKVIDTMPVENQEIHI